MLSEKKINSLIYRLTLRSAKGQMRKNYQIGF